MLPRASAPNVGQTVFADESIQCADAGGRSGQASAAASWAYLPSGRSGENEGIDGILVADAAECLSGRHLCCSHMREGLASGGRRRPQGNEFIDDVA